MGTPLTLLTLGVYTKIGGSRDPPVPRESPAQNNEGLLVLSSVPPGTATRWRPPYLYLTDQSKQSSGGKDIWQFPRESPAQNNEGLCSEQRPPRDSYQVETPLSSFS